MMKLRRLGTLLVLIVSPAAVANAQETLWPRGTIGLGGFFATTDFEARVDASASQPGTAIDFERDLGVGGDQDVLAASLEFRTGRRHEWTLGYYEIDNSGRRAIERQVTIGDQVFPAGAELTSEYQITQIEGSYTFWLARQERFGFGLSLGAVAFMVDAEAAARVRVGGVTVERREEASTTAPVPLLGAEVRGLLGQRFIASAEARFLPEVDIGDVSGDVTAGALGLEWRVVDSFGLGVSYDFFTIQADFDESSWQGNVDVSIEGWRLFGRYLW